MEHVEIARLFYEYADLLDIQGDSPFRVRAYRKVAQTIEGLSRPEAQLVEEGEDLIQLLGGDRSCQIQPQAHDRAHHLRPDGWRGV